ncbi:MAG TPA: ABC transporter permease [Gemmatimonadaceae bacterium]|nr:ABC transporter permease [Gemmatimonadaceae bacterium]
MSIFERLRNHFRDNAMSKDIRKEMQFHLAERADDLMATGMTASAAQREARRRFGSLAYQGERTRERDLFGWLDKLLADLRYALRSLKSAPAFALVAILSLGLGIGANTAIFSIIDALILKSLPVHHPEELVAVVRDERGSVFTNPLWEAIRDRQDVFSGVFAYASTNFNLTSGGEARRLDASWVSGDYFRTLGVQPVTGRLIARADDYRGCPGVAVLSEAFWSTRYAGDPGVIGKTISFDGHPFEIIGVADGRFFGVSVGQRPQAFVPLCSEAIIRGANSQLDHRSSWFLQIVGRPKAGLSTQQANARLAVLTPAIIDATIPPNWSVESLQNYRKATYRVVPAAKGFSDLREMYTKPLYILMAIVGVVLLIACANVANLLLARATVRQREMAVRLALGAGRARLARQLITESLLLAAIGALVGALFASWGSRLLVSLISRSDRLVSLDLGVDQRVLAFTIAITTLTGLLFGLVPAWRAGRVDPQAAMKAQGRGVAEGQSRFGLGKVLVVAQIALSLVLIVAAGLLMGSWRKLATVDPGFRRDQVLLVDADIRGTATAPDQRLALHEQMLNALRATPGVRSASASQITPIAGYSWNELVKTEGFTPKNEDDALSWANAVSDGYFSTLGIPILAGRDFDSRDTKTSGRVVIVNEAMARHFFSTPAAVGRRMQKQEGSSWSQPIEVVGVVGTTKYTSLRDSAQPIMYFPRAQESAEAQHVSFELRTNGVPTAIVPAATKALAALSPRITLDFTTLDEQLARSLTLMRLIATLSGFFGMLAVLLATIGLYGIMAYNVARRRNEIGVRIALGAEQSRVVRMILGEVSRVVLAGTVLGVVLSSAVTRLVASFLYGVTPTDVSTLSASVALLAAVGIAAAAVPAWRAARLDPVAALREE